MPRTRIALAALFLLAWLASSGCSSAPSYHARTLSGEEFTDQSLRGSVVLVQFWTTWCQYCRRDQDAVDALARQYSSSGLMVLAVNVGQSREEMKDYLRRSPRRCRVVASEDTNLASALGADSFPYYVLIGRDGAIVADQHGSGGEESLRDLLSKAGIGAPL